MTGGMRLIIESRYSDAYVRVQFEHETRGVVVDVMCLSLAEAMTAAIQQFKDMQEAAVEELAKYGLISFRSEPAILKGDPS